MTKDPSPSRQDEAARLLRERARKRMETTPGAVDIDRTLPATPEAWREELLLLQIERDIQAEELHRTRGELARVRAGYRDLFEHAPLAYLLLDEDGVIRDANPPAAELLGAASAPELEGQAFAEFLAPSALEQWARCRAAQSAGGATRAATELGLHCDQCPLRRLVRMECVTEVACTEGGGVHGLFALIDLTEQRQAEEDREALIDLVEASPQLLAGRLGVKPVDDAEDEPTP
ncbi:MULTISPECIES: PAS domain S-box protein [Halorhodospira]|uniref:PAS domain S-box protein n=1 Tax=Halorhodospira TaxID=85108 RepID=UPI0019137F75|nr:MULTISPECIES: PAS domain S-box protein [Halorhodospira]MCG5537227.1 PAS domain S-box protein [Halorhodospira sp. 9622]